MGFPNYFGPQRFGRHNLSDALHWLNHRRDRPCAQGQPSTKRVVPVRATQLGVQRLLAQRVADGSWQTCLDCDVIEPGEGQAAPVPLGPLWGRGRERCSGEALLRQQRSFASIKTPDEKQSLGAVCEALEHAGVNRGERRLVVKPWAVCCEQDLSNETLMVSFCLPVGAYATVM